MSPRVTGVNKKEVSAVLEALGNEIKKAMGSKGPGVFAIPGLVKIEKKKVPARPAQRRAQSLQARRIDGRGGQAGQHENQGSSAEAVEGDGLRSARCSAHQRRECGVTSPAV